MKKKGLSGAVVVCLVITVILGIAFAGYPLQPAAKAKQKNGQDCPSQALPALFTKIADKFAGCDIPVYVPAYLPGEGFYGITDFKADKSSYSFEVIKADIPDSAETAGPVSMADRLINISASETPFSSYPTEEQIFAKPDGTLQIDGIAAESYEKGMEVTWSEGKWEFFALGHAEQDGIRVARETIQALPDDKDLVPGAVQGKLRVSQTGNPMYVTASWTYDGKIWYTLDGRSSPAERIKMLQAVMRLSVQEPGRDKYYPQVPERITSPEMALQAYFDALYYGGA